MESSTIINNLSQSEIIQEWAMLRETKPGIRIREAAVEMGLSEAQLLATTAGSEAVRLNTQWQGLLESFPSLGHVMSLTRNDACVLEHKGTFQKINSFGGGNHKMATVIGPIETRVFFNAWHLAFAVEQPKGDRPLTSIQIFDAAGSAITKIYLTENSNVEAYHALVEKFKASNQQSDLSLSPYPAKALNENIDADQFLEDWSQLKDTHDFFPLLGKYKADRFRAIELAAGRFTTKINVSSIQAVLEKSAEQKLPIMVFAGNRGNLQIHQGKVKTIRMMERGQAGAERWLNILDPDFNMHLRIDLVQSAWIVVKPTSDGDVTSIECYDNNNELVVQFFGLRKPGTAELSEWKQLVEGVANL